MKITINNFGPIQEFTYDLSKDIIVTYGDNNIGKSYAMQIIYLLLKNLHDNFSFDNYIFKFFLIQKRFDISNDKIKSLIEEFSTKDINYIDITDNINSVVLSILAEGFIQSFKNSCNNTFGNLKGILEQNPTIRMCFGNDYFLTIKLAEKNSLESNIYSTPTHLKKTTSKFHKSRKSNNHLYIYFSGDKNATYDVITNQVNKTLKLFSSIITAKIPNVYFLPASRSGIYSGMSAFSSIIAELSKNKAILTKKIELPGISEPISDYFLHLSNIKGKENSYFADIYNEIEKDILKGKVSFNKVRNTLVYTPQNINHEFEMTEVSSMVSEISPIVAFFKYIVTYDNYRRPKESKSKSILFIEEPEAHLHPKNQIKFIELFSKLQSYNIKLIISSHSNYIFNKLNNLLLSKNITPDTYSPILLLSENGSSISRFMKIDELGVDDENFLDVTQNLYNEREEIIETLIKQEQEL